ncbi:malate transporter [Haematobacter missouriensis]|uniref:Malate transporter n=1 Tax=Haematobacter missouriensis TaxID=366616 RepID=A0A212AK11_9RHOB|nr:AEC family transporter [Haematobacter missouriensis]KFI32584.1 malate transporter [Haematobacter missouriensis]OWJ76746.1 malate transporter [Haematobacter missouriensis]OWJ81756.1 malate transporter [Haematobacter missouriensis]
MLPVFLKTLPFFALIGLGWIAARRGFCPPEATAWLTRFVFFLPLSAMLFGFAASLPLSALHEPVFIAAYAGASLAVYALTGAVALLRGCTVAEAAVEAQCGVVGNTGFFGLPMFVTLLGPKAAAPILIMLLIDLVVFSTLITVIMTLWRDRRFDLRIFPSLGRGLIGNPMIVSMVAGVLWSASGVPLPAPVKEFVTLLGAAATPCALFAIGASLAGRNAERPAVAAWLSAVKLLLHPLTCAVVAFWLLPVDPFAAGLMVATAALPVAGNVYMLAQHYGVAPLRVSTAILFSTAASVITLPLIIARVLMP